MVRGVDQRLRNSRPLQNTREREPRRVATLLATWAVVVSNSKRAYHVHAACTYTVSVEKPGGQIQPKCSIPSVWYFIDGIDINSVGPPPM